MADIPERILRIVETYVARLNNEIPVEKAILFGSYAKGTYDNESDIDIAIFSDYFKELRKVDGINFLLQKAAEFDIDLEPLPFTTNDYSEDDFVKEILKHGIEIKIKQLV